MSDTRISYEELWNDSLEASQRIIELERERDEARRELDETISCIEQAIDFHQVHHQSFQASAIKNLLENINQRRKHDPR